MPNVTSFPNSKTLITSEDHSQVRPNWFDVNYWGTQNGLEGTATGRGTVWFIKHHENHYVLRKYRRGGLIAKINRFAFFYLGIKRTRVFQELHLLEIMRALSLPVPEPIAGLVKRQGLQYQAYLLTKTIDNAEEVFQRLQSQRNVPWQDIGSVIKRFHDHGIFHSDLNCHNILLDNQNTVWIIDFDKCEQRPQQSEWKLNNLSRLKRSLDKEMLKLYDQHFSDHHWQALLKGYHGQ